MSTWGSTRLEPLLPRYRFGGGWTRCGVGDSEQRVLSRCSSNVVLILISRVTNKEEKNVPGAIPVAAALLPFDGR